MQTFKASELRVYDLQRGDLLLSDVSGFLGEVCEPANDHVVIRDWSDEMINLNPDNTWVSELSKDAFGFGNGPVNVVIRPYETGEDAK